MKKNELAKHLVATELTIGCTESQIVEFTLQAAQRGLLGVCVYQNMLLTAIKAAQGSDLKVFTVAGFPSGRDVPITKVSDVKLSSKRGAFEVDMCINLSAWKSNDMKTLREELAGGAEAAHCHGGRFSAVLNTCNLDKDSIHQLSAMCVTYGADSIKTISGDSVIPRATTEDDVKFIRTAVGENALVKAEGQIATLDKAIELLKAGADVICSKDAFAIFDSAEE